MWAAKIVDMKPARPYAALALASLTMLLYVAASVYVGGYVLLPDKQGLFQSKWHFELYEPAMRAQRQITGEPVVSGYVGPNGARFAKRLP
jgi:hypothetical protein